MSWSVVMDLHDYVDSVIDTTFRDFFSHQKMESLFKSIYELYPFHSGDVDDDDDDSTCTENNLMVKIDGTFLLLNEETLIALRKLKAQLYAHANGNSNYHPEEHHLIGAKIFLNKERTKYVQIRADEIIEPTILCVRPKSETGAVVCLVNPREGSVPIGVVRKDSERMLKYNDTDAIFSCLTQSAPSMSGSFDPLTMIFCFN